MVRGAQARDQLIRGAVEDIVVPAKALLHAHIF
jgi:hypothetical protein